MVSSPRLSRNEATLPPVSGARSTKRLPAEISTISFDPLRRSVRDRAAAGPPAVDRACARISIFGASERDLKGTHIACNVHFLRLACPGRTSRTADSAVRYGNEEGQGKEAGFVQRVVAIMGTLDSKGVEFAFLKTPGRGRGRRDPGHRRRRARPAGLSARHRCRRGRRSPAGPTSRHSSRRSDRGRAMAAMSRGGAPPSFVSYRRGPHPRRDLDGRRRRHRHRHGGDARPSRSACRS